MRLKIIYLLLLNFLCFSLAAQTLELSDELNITGKQIKVDKLGNVYVVSDYAIFKLNHKGDTLNFFSTKRYGLINQLDVSIPQKPLVFYKESGILLELDFTLSENSAPINLFQHDLVKPQLVIQSTLNNGFWIYDAGKYELFHFDKNFTITSSSGNLMLLKSLPDFNPTQLDFKNNKVYLTSKKTGVLVFDQYATYLNTLSFTDYEKCFMANNGYILATKNIITISDLSLLNYKNLPIDIKYDDLFYINQKLYFLSTKGVKIYDIKGF